MVFSIACTGSFSDGGLSSGASGAPGSGNAGSGAASGEPAGGRGSIPAECAGETEAGVAPLRRLGRVEYVNSLRDLLAPSGLAAEVDALSAELEQLPPDGENAHLFTDMDARVTQRHIDAFYGVADALSRRLTSSPAGLRALLGACGEEAALSEACLGDFVEGFGRRVYRRPLTAAEKSRVLELRGGGTPPAEIARGVLFTFLLSPPFLYRFEHEGEPLASNPSVLALTPHEIASRLAFHFWRSMPDDALLAAADAGELATESGYAAAVERVFADPRTQATLRRFFAEWFQLEGFAGFTDTPAFRAFADDVAATPDLAAAMREEIDALVDHYAFETEGTYTDLLTSNLSFARAPELAELYGVPAWSGAGTPPALPAGERSGLLTRAALLVEGNELTNPVKRGAFVLRHVLCTDIDPPSNLPAEALAIPPIDPELSTRQRFEAKTAPAECAGCHAVINPLGFGLEAYDALGRFRGSERIFSDAGELVATQPVDARVEVLVGGVRTPVANPVEYSRAIAESAAAGECFARQYFRFSYRRDEAAGDSCALAAVKEEIAAGGSLEKAFLSVALAPAFRQRLTEVP